jgi:hypothetical protein
MDFNDEQPESARDSIRVSFDPFSNVNDESRLQSEKEPSPRNSTEAGRQIDSNDEHQESVHASIRVNFDPDSNLNEQIERQEEKQPTPRIAI